MSLTLDPPPTRRTLRTPRGRPIGPMTPSGDRLYVPHPLEAWDMEELEAVCAALLASLADGEDPADQMRRCFAASRRCGRVNPEPWIVDEIIGTVTGHCGWMLGGSKPCP